jgi:hypothetical protein
MVAARYADEGDDAIPADRMVLDPVPLTTIDDIKITQGDYSIPTGQLYLRPDHRYKLTITDERGQRIGSQIITVKTPGEPLMKMSQEPSKSGACGMGAPGQTVAGSAPCHNP